MPTDYRTRLKELRLRRAVTQKQLAAAVGLTASHVSMIESCKREVRVPTMIAMLKALGSTMGEFFDPQPRAGHDLQSTDIVLVRTDLGVQPYTVTIVRDRAVLVSLADGPSLDPDAADIVSVTRHRIGRSRNLDD